MPDEVTTRPVQPTLRTAPAVEEIHRRQMANCRLCRLPAMVIVGVVLVVAFFVGKAAYDFARNASGASSGAGPLILAGVLGIGVIVACILLMHAIRRWSAVTPLPEHEQDAISRLVGDLYLQNHGSEAQSQLARYHSEVLAMNREFSYYDLKTMQAYCADMDRWDASMKNYEMELVLRRSVGRGAFEGDSGNNARSNTGSSAGANPGTEARRKPG